VKDAPRSLSDLAQKHTSSAQIYCDGRDCLDRLLKLRSALQKPDFRFDFAAASRRFKEFVGRAGLHRDGISSFSETFI